MLNHALPSALHLRPRATRHVKPVATRQDRFQTGLAELMLLNRLRARNRHDLTSQTLERAAHIIAVTSRHWFGVAPELSVSQG